MKLLRLLVFLVAAAGADQAQALVIIYDLSVEFSNGTPPAGPTPWVTITIDDSVGGPNDVRVTISNLNITGVEFVSEVSLNFDPVLDPTQLGFSAVNTAAVASVGFSTGVDAFQADGDGKFDILFALPPPPGSFAAKFTAGETLVFDLSYIAPISAGSFDFFSAPGGGQGTFHAAAHVQGIGAGGEDSGWIGDGFPPAPEPTVLGLFGLAGLLFVGRRRA
jgi:hypothetical protein